jgi:2-C-methyl-D-erythritol 4-phosphate cytidylyltransferase
MAPYNVAIITAAGFGKRMGTDKPKQYLELSNKPILIHTLEKFEKARLIDEIILVTDPSSVTIVREIILGKYPSPKVKKIVAGGEQRQDSVAKGLANVSPGCEIVCVHDGVRPFITPELIDKSVEEAMSHGACIVAIPMKDTIKRVDEEGQIVETVERSGLWRAQTPQTFKFNILKEAFEKAFETGFYGTDEAMLVERINKEICILSGDERNIKITTPDDLKIAETLCV